MQRSQATTQTTLRGDFDHRAPGLPDMPQDPQGRQRIRRPGIAGWWLDLTAPPLPRALGSISIEERERLRKAELTSVSILAIMAFLLALVSNSLADPSTGQAVATMAVVLVVAAVLNRASRATSWRTHVAAYMVPAIMMLLVMAAILQAGGGLRLIWLPAYDLLALPIFISSLTANRRAPWIFGFIAIAFIALDFNLQGHALITGAGASHFDDIAYETQIWTPWGMVNRHIALCLFAAFFGWLGARSVDNAIARADRAEEVARLEHAVAEQRRQLETGVQQLLETHVRLANGDMSARAPLIKDNLLWQVAASLNNLISRMQNAFRAEHQLRRLEEELHRLAAALDDAKAGRPPLWPAPTGTAADLITDRLTGRGRQSAGGPGALPRRPQQYGQSALQPSSPGASPQIPSSMPGQWQSENAFSNPEAGWGDSYGAQDTAYPGQDNSWRRPPEGY